MPASGPPPTPRSRWNSAVPRYCSTPRSQRRAIPSPWLRACALPSRPADWRAWPAAYRSSPMRSRRAHNSALWGRDYRRVAARRAEGALPMKLPDPALLLVTDRHQARLPLADIVRAALSAGCRWVSVREKDLSDDDQIALVSTLLPIARRHGARLTLHGDAALAKACGSDGVHLPAGGDPAASRARPGPGRLSGGSRRTVAEAGGSEPGGGACARRGPGFEPPARA